MNFKRTALALVLAGAALATTATASLADPRNFTVVNNSSLVITHLYVSATDTASWEEDILGRDVLGPGEQVPITFSKYDGDSGKCLYDMKVITKEGAEAVKAKLDLCQLDTFTWND